MLTTNPFAAHKHRWVQTCWKPAPCLQERSSSEHAARIPFSSAYHTVPRAHSQQSHPWAGTGILQDRDGLGCATLGWLPQVGFQWMGCWGSWDGAQSTGLTGWKTRMWRCLCCNQPQRHRVIVYQYYLKFTSIAGFKLINCGERLLFQ